VSVVGSQVEESGGIGFYSQDLDVKFWKENFVIGYSSDS
jgi:hypothetical protein